MKAIALLTLLVLSACARQGPPPYAEHYASALERYPGVPQPAEVQIQRFVDFFSEHGQPGAPSAETLYAPQLYFSDTLLTTENHERVVAHLERMRKSADDLNVEVLDHVHQDAVVYILWRMRARLTPIRETFLSDTIGMTHLRFDENGRIVLQQDFWDSTEGFHRYLPVVGPIVSAVNRRFADAD